MQAELQRLNKDGPVLILTSLALKSNDCLYFVKPQDNNAVFFTQYFPHETAICFSR
jgi:hypothetical protein